MDVASSLDPALKHRRLVVAPPGQGPPPNPVTAALYNPTLLAKIWPVGEKVSEAQFRSSILSRRCKGHGAFRLVSKDARAAFDAACEAPLVFGAQQNCYGWRGGEPAGPSPSEAVVWTLGMLQRGRRPRVVHVEATQGGGSEGWRQGALDLLRAMPQLSGRPGEGVAALELPADLLSPSTAPLIAGALPNLARLELMEVEDGRLSPAASHEAARGLALLLKGVPGAEGGGASAGVGGKEAGGASSEEAEGAEGGEGSDGGPSSGTAPLLPRLTALKLSPSPAPLRSLPPGLAPVLRQAPQLRTLDLGGLTLSEGVGAEGSSRGPLEELASLTQLTALSLHSCAATILPVLTGALTRLTSLELQTQEYDDLPLSPSVFAPLQGLQRLEVPRTSLEVAELAEALSSLTRLSVGGFTLPAQELSQPLTSIPRWRLPAGLRELGLNTGRGTYGMPPEVLAGLDPHPGLCLDCDSPSNLWGNLGSFTLTPGRHTAPPVEEDGQDDEEDAAGKQLLPAAEGALCKALRLMGEQGFQKGGEIYIAFVSKDAEISLLPVGGAAGTGPGRPNHRRWLWEVAGLRPKRLTLQGISLSYQDVEEIVGQMKDLEYLILKPPGEISVPAIPLLAGLRSLKELCVDALSWAGDDEDSIELRGQALASLVTLARTRPEPETSDDRPLTVELAWYRQIDNTDYPRLRSLGLRALAQMEACGAEPITIVAGDLDVEIDPDESDGLD